MTGHFDTISEILIFCLLFSDILVSSIQKYVRLPPNYFSVAVYLQLKEKM